MKDDEEDEKKKNRKDFLKRITENKWIYFPSKTIAMWLFFFVRLSFAYE